MKSDLEPIVVLDACVLYPAPMRDLLLYLASQKIYHPKWSAEINEEWVRNLLLNRSDLSNAQLQKTVNAMNRAFPEANIRKAPSIIKQLILPDPNDRHVLATTIKSKAKKIITANLKDFPTNYLQQFNIQAQHPDKFLPELIDTYPEQSITAFHQQVNNLKNPPLSTEDVLNSLNKCGLEQTVLILKDLLDK